MQKPGEQERGRDGADDNRQGLAAGLDDHLQVHPKAQENDGHLQDILGRPLDPAGRAFLLFPKEGDDHAKQDGEDGAPDNWQGLA